MMRLAEWDKVHDVSQLISAEADVNLQNNVRLLLLCSLILTFVANDFNYNVTG